MERSQSVYKKAHSKLARFMPAHSKLAHLMFPRYKFARSKLAH
jgi:hypothetical protein